MSKFKAADDTISRLFQSYTKQGKHKHKAIMLIAASLELLQKDVLDALKKMRLRRLTIWCPHASKLGGSYEEFSDLCSPVEASTTTTTSTTAIETNDYALCSHVIYLCDQ